MEDSPITKSTEAERCGSTDPLLSEIILHSLAKVKRNFVKNNLALHGKRSEPKQTDHADIQESGHSESNPMMMETKSIITMNVWVIQETNHARTGMTRCPAPTSRRAHKVDPHP